MACNLVSLRRVLRSLCICTHCVYVYTVHIFAFTETAKAYWRDSRWWRVREISRFHIFSVVCLLSVCFARVHDWGVETHTYIMRNTRTITYLLLCNVKLHFELCGIAIGIRMQLRHCDITWLVSMRVCVLCTLYCVYVVALKCIYDAHSFSMQSNLYTHTYIKWINSVFSSVSQWKLNIGNDIKRLFKFKCSSLAQSLPLRIQSTLTRLSSWPDTSIKYCRWKSGLGVCECEFIPSLLIQNASPFHL